MGWIIKIRPLAYLDLDNVIEWYNLQRQGLGQEFLMEFNKYVEKLQIHPYSHLTIFESVRRVALKRFPYKILFTIDNEGLQITILGIVHYKRSSRYVRRYR